jgi:hypothetical protein
MSEPFGSPVGTCALCDRPAVEDVDAERVEGQLMHLECVEAEFAFDPSQFPSEVVGNVEFANVR